MTVFADSSALVKLYADEVDAELVRGQAPYVVAGIARVEVPAALWRKQCMGELSAEDAAVLAADFAFSWHDARGPFVPVSVRAGVLEPAAALARPTACARTTGCSWPVRRLLLRWTPRSTASCASTSSSARPRRVRVSSSSPERAPRRRSVRSVP